MVEITEEEVVNLDNLADGMSEVRKYKSKPQKEKSKYKEKPQETAASEKQGIKGGVVAFFIFALVVLLSVVGYVTVVYGSIPVVVKWRDKCIEKAMTNEDYELIATAVLPDRLIDEVMTGSDSE